MAKVRLVFPKQLPMRLSRLKQACIGKVFNANPASCPAGSSVGQATAITPVLPGPLSGPAYFVSYGGAKFPELFIVISGYGVTVELDGQTNIQKGITSSTFEAVPDAPIGSFELTLPAGPYSALAAVVEGKMNGSLCGTKLAMPTAFTAQNGAEIHQTTPIEVEGCSKSISVSSHSVNKRALTLSIYVPSAGKLTASGKGLLKSSKSSKGRETLTLVLNEAKAGKLTTKVKLTFTPAKGSKQSKSLAVTFKK